MNNAMWTAYLLIFNLAAGMWLKPLDAAPSHFAVKPSHGEMAVKAMT